MTAANDNQPAEENHRQRTPGSLPPTASPAVDFARVVESDTDGVTVFDPEGRYIYVNAAAERLLGCARSLMLGRTILDVWPNAANTPYLSAIHHAAKTGRVVIAEFAVDNRPHAWLEARCVPLEIAAAAGGADSAGLVSGLIVHWRDITEAHYAAEALRRSAAQARAASRALDAIQDGFMTLDRDFRITYINAEAARINGKPAEASLGRTHWEEWPASLGTAVEENYRRALSERVSIHFEHHYRVPGAYDAWFAISVYPAGEADGSGLHVVYRDITARVQRERRDRFLSELAERSRAVGDPDAVIADAVRSLGKYLGVDRCTFADIDLEAGTATIHPDYCAPGVPSIAGVQPLASFGPFLTAGFHAGRPVIVHDIYTDAIRVPPEAIATYEAIRIRAHVTVPLVHTSRWVSTIAVHSSVARQWLPDEVELLRTVVERTWLTVEVARQHRAAARLAEERERVLREYAGILASMTEGLIVAAPDGTVLSMNPAALALHGYAIDHPFVERSLSDFYAALEITDAPMVQGGEPVPHDRWPLSRALAGETFRGYEVYVRNGDTGREWWGSYGGALVRGEDDAPMFALVTIRDATARRRAEAERDALLAQQTRVAETLQNSMLLAPPEDAFAGLSVGTHYEAAWAEAQVGGDFMDALPLDGGRVALIVGDSTGKGLKAARHVSEMQFVLRAYLREIPDPARTLERLNAYLVSGQRLDGRAQSALAAVIVAVVSPETGETWIAAGGAEPPVVLRADTGQAEEVAVGGVVLGANERATFEAMRLILRPGDLLIMATDGLTEARDRKSHTFFGYEGLLRAVESEAGAAPAPAAFARRLAARARAFAGGVLSDDVCIVAARRLDLPLTDAGEGEGEVVTVSSGDPSG